VTEAEALVARWAAFEDHVPARGETTAEPEV